MATRAWPSMLPSSSPSPSEPTLTIPPPPTLNQPRLIRCPNTYFAVSWLLCVVYLVDAMVSIIAQLIVVCNHLHNGCKWHKYLSPQRISTKPSAYNATQGMGMTIVHSAGSSPCHRPSNLLITHAYRKPPFTWWCKWWQLFFPPTDFDQTKRIRHHPWCVDEVAPSGLGVATPQAMNSRRNNDHRKRDHDEKVALFQDFSQKIGQNQKSRSSEGLLWVLVEASVS